MEPFEATTLSTDGEMRVALRGELDLASAAQAEQALLAAEATTPAALVIDLRGLRFMDSTGLRLLVAVDRRARAAGCALTVVRGQEAVSRVLEITGVAARLNMVDDA